MNMNNLSEEEKQAIRIVNNYLLYSNINRTENDEACELVNLKVLKAMRKVLNLVEKQQKEIEDKNQFIDELQFRYNIEHQSKIERYISKDKIREKIKELEEIVEFSKKQTENYYDYGAEIEILQELLGDE